MIFGVCGVGRVCGMYVWWVYGYDVCIVCGMCVCLWHVIFGVCGVYNCDVCV